MRGDEIFLILFCAEEKKQNLYIGTKKRSELFTVEWNCVVLDSDTILSETCKYFHRKFYFMN